jgi:hypothetical protein
MTQSNGSDQAAMEYGLEYNPPMNGVTGERNLKEAKIILDNLGVVFLLQSGSCLGAVRDNAFIPWDDDIDIVSVMGMNDLTEETIYVALAAFRSRGYYVRKNYSNLDGPPYGISHSVIKDYARLDWSCLLVVDGFIRSYPGVQVPATSFTHPREIEFLGEKFFVPNPPEEYLRLKYGARWMVPRKAGEYEKDVVEKIPSTKMVGGTCRFRVLDHEGEPMPSAEVVLVGGSSSKTDEYGYAEIILPVTVGSNYYALIIRYLGHEQVLYEEEMAPDKNYVYRAGAYSTKAGSAFGEYGTLGNVLLTE